MDEFTSIVLVLLNAHMWKTTLRFSHVCARSSHSEGIRWPVHYELLLIGWYLMDVVHRSLWDTILWGDSIVLWMTSLWVSTYVPPSTWSSLEQFGYIQIMPQDPTVASPTIILCGDVDEIFALYFDHLVPEDVRCVSTHRPWNTVYDYIQWFYRVSYSFMTPSGEGDSTRPAHEEILEEEHARVNHVVDAFLIYHWIVAIGIDVIAMREFEESTP